MAIENQATVETNEEGIDLNQIQNLSVNAIEINDPDQQDSPTNEEVEEEETEEVEEEEEVEEITSSTEEVAEDSDDELLNIVAALEAEFEIELTEEELNTLDTTDTSKAINQLTKIVSQKESQAAVENLFAQNPDLYEAFLYKQANGSLIGFGEEINYPDYSTIDLTQKDNQKLIYSKALELQGVKPIVIADMIELAEDKGTLEKRATDSQKEVQDYFATKKEDQSKANAAKIEAIKQEEVAIAKEIRSTIATGKILGVTLSKKEQAEFDAYITKPIDKQGRTAKQINDEKITLEQELYLEYQKMKGFQSIVPKENPRLTALRTMKKGTTQRVAPVGQTKSSINGLEGSQEIDMVALSKLNLNQ